MNDEIQRSAELIERLLGNPALRRQFRTDPASVLLEAGLPQLAAGLGQGRRALMTLEMRESRSSLAGVMVAAAAEGVDFAQVAAHAAPALAREARQAVEHLVDQPHHQATPAPHHVSRAPGAAASAQAELQPPAQTPQLRPPSQSPPPQPPSQMPPPQPPAPAASPPPGASANAAAHGALPASASAAGAGLAAGGGTMAGAGPLHHPEAARIEFSPSGRQAQPSASQAEPSASQADPSGSQADPSGSHAQPPGARPGGHPRPAPAPRDRHPASASGQAAAAGAEQTLPAPGGAFAYPGDGASPQALAAWMGARAQAAGLPPELPVMAALTESGLHNLAYGDRDSVGFFQMRTGIWDQGAYAGYPDHPELQIQWFIDHALAVRAQNPALAQGPDSWGEWVADVEQPAAQYRYRYQLQLGSAQALLSGAHLGSGAAAGQAAVAGGASPPGAISAAGAENAVATAAAPPPPPPGEGALRAAMSLLSGSGDAGARPADSGALVVLAYARQGIQLPGAAVQQFDLGIPVPRGSLHAGDVIFLAGPNGQLDQEGLYAGGGRFLTVSPQDGSLELASLSDPHFAHAFAGARRFTLQALENPGSYARPLPTIAPAPASPPVSGGPDGSGAAATGGSGS